MSLTQITDMATRARARVLAQYKALTARFLPLLDVFTEGAQETEDMLWAFIEQLVLDTADGVWLDNLGAIAGEPRDGEAVDATYRKYIRARALANISQGRVEDLIAVAAAVLDEPYWDLVITERPPAAFNFQISDAGVNVLAYDSDRRRRLIRLLRATRGAGIGQQVLTRAWQSGQTFTFSPTGLLIGPENSQGFYDSAGSTGGYFRDVEIA